MVLEKKNYFNLGNKKGKHLGLINKGNVQWGLGRFAYGNLSLNDFYPPLPKPKRYKP